MSLKINIIFSLLGQAQLIGEAGRERTPNLIEGICNAVLLAETLLCSHTGSSIFLFLAYFFFSTAGHSINSMFAWDKEPSQCEQMVSTSMAIS